VGQILHRNATTTDAVGRGTLPSQPDRFKISSNPPLGRLGLDRRRKLLVDPPIASLTDERTKRDAIGGYDLAVVEAVGATRRVRSYT